MVLRGLLNGVSIAETLLTDGEPAMEQKEWEPVGKARCWEGLRKESKERET
jgi:hypothetical protein